MGCLERAGTWSERDLDASTYLGEAHEEAWDEKTRSCLWVLSETKFAKNLFIHHDQSEQTIPPNGCLLPASPSPHIAAHGLTCDTFRLLRRQVLRPLPTPAREPESVCSSTLGTVTRRHKGRKWGSKLGSSRLLEPQKQFLSLLHTPEPPPSSRAEKFNQGSPSSP